MRWRLRWNRFMEQLFMTPKPSIAGIHSLVFDAKRRLWVCTREGCTFTCNHYEYHRTEHWEPSDLKCPVKGAA